MMRSRSALRRLAAALCVLSLAACAAACTSGGTDKKGGTLRILAGSELSDLKPILDQAKKDIGVTVKLDYAGTLAGVQRVLDGTAGRDHDAIWFSSNRYLALHPEAQSRLGPSVKIMSSPVLLGLRTSVARRLGWDHARPTWAAIAAAASAGKFTYGMTNPVSSNSGFSALVGVAAALSGTGAALDGATIDRVAPRLRGFFAAQRITSGSSGWLSDTYAADPGRADGLINYESVLLTLNASHRLPEPLTLVYPADGVVTADYPLTQLSTASGPATDELRRLSDYLRRPAVQRRIMTMTHRRPTIPQARMTAEFAAQPPELPFPGRADAADALIDAYFNRLRRPARTIYVLDVSGSMRGARLASLKAALTALTGADISLSGRFQRFHDREEVTLLPFSSTPGRPDTFVVPPTGSSAELTKIRDSAQTLTAGGSTAIYESLEKAYSVIGGSAGDRITSIVLMSDGESNQGATAGEFRDWYGRQPLALRRVPVFPILFGESATGEMNGLAALTRGKVFDARLQSLSAVFGEIRGYQYLLGPPERVSLVIDDTVAEAGRLRADLDGLVARVRSHRPPAEAVDRLEEIASMLGDLLNRSDLLRASPESLYEVSRAIRTDLPTSFETYLNLPRRYAARPGSQGAASAELLTQLGLISASVSRTAGDVYATEAQRMRDHTKYLRDREDEGELRLPPVRPARQHVRDDRFNG